MTMISSIAEMLNLDKNAEMAMVSYMAKLSIMKKWFVAEFENWYDILSEKSVQILK